LCCRCAARVGYCSCKDRFNGVRADAHDQLDGGRAGEVNCAVPNTADPSQRVAAASQKVTSPEETGKLPVMTVAASITCEPLATVPGDTPKTDTVLAGAACAIGTKRKAIAANGKLLTVPARILRGETRGKE